MRTLLDVGFVRRVTTTREPPIFCEVERFALGCPLAIDSAAATALRLRVLLPLIVDTLGN